jgi:hypothetical protein
MFLLLNIGRDEAESGQERQTYLPNILQNRGRNRHIFQMCRLWQIFKMLLLLNIGADEAESGQEQCAYSFIRIK